jgi:hypothetical protein
MSHKFDALASTLILAGCLPFFFGAILTRGKKVIFAIFKAINRHGLELLIGLSLASKDEDLMHLL